MTDLDKLKAMPHNSELYLNWHEEGGALVHRLWDAWILFEVPQYGGEPMCYKAFFEGQLTELIEVADNWN